MKGARAALLCLPVVVSGCVTIDGTLRADGSARFAMLYRTAPDATEFLERRRFSSPNVTVDALKIFEDQMTAVWVTVPDVTRLGGAKGFENVAVKRERRGADEVLTISLKNAHPVAQENPGRLMSLSVTLPGPVREASHSAAVLGSRLTWTVTEGELASHPAVVLRARYTPPPP